MIKLSNGINSSNFFLFSNEVHVYYSDIEKNIECHNIFIENNKRQRIPKVQSQIDNPEKLATYGTQDEENKNATQYVLDTTTRKHFSRVHKMINLSVFFCNHQQPIPMSKMCFVGNL